MKYTERAVREFLETDTKFPRRIIWAMGKIKRAAALANMQAGLLDEKRAYAIAEVAERLAIGEFDEKVIVDVFQTGSGTGLNMNVNEVISEEASKIAGVEIHPNDHVNMSQSSNDVVPTAIRVAAVAEAQWNLIPALDSLIESLTNAEERFSREIKPGRTHFRDALPVTLGQELGAFRSALQHDKASILDALKHVMEVPLGGTAVGTGLNAHQQYFQTVVDILAAETGLPLKPADTRMRPMRLLTDISMLSGAYRSLALDLWRFSQDLRIMFSGPNTGISEIDLPQEIPGSSMMPGKVNPVTLEAVMQATAQVVGLDTSITMASLLGELELSMGIPLAGYNIVVMSGLLTSAIIKISENVIPRIKPLSGRMKDLAYRSQALVTILAPIIGYDKAAKLSRMMGSGASIWEALDLLGIDPEKAKTLLDPEKLTRPGIPALEIREGENIDS